MENTVFPGKIYTARHKRHLQSLNISNRTSQVLSLCVSTWDAVVPLKTNKQTKGRGL